MDKVVLAHHGWHKRKISISAESLQVWHPVCQVCGIVTQPSSHMQTWFWDLSRPCFPLKPHVFRCLALPTETSTTSLWKKHVWWFLSEKEIGAPFVNSQCQMNEMTSLATLLVQSSSTDTLSARSSPNNGRPFAFVNQALKVKWYTPEITKLTKTVNE